MVMKKNNLLHTWFCLGIFLVFAYSGHVQASYNEAFYQPPADLSGYARGDLIRWEQEPNMDAALTKYGTAYRVMYVSKGAAGNKIAVTGMVLIPSKTTGPLEAVVWAHGTVGVGDDCAPSKWPMLYPIYAWDGYLLPASDILKNGYAAIAPDYEGMGTPGPHPWLHHESAGNTIIDGVRAYVNLAPQAGFLASSRWGVWGHSQGAMAARAANVLANSAAPELTFVGSVEVAGITSANIAQTLLESTLTGAALTGKFAHVPGISKKFMNLPLFPFWGYAAQSIQALYPGSDVRNFLGPFLLEQAEVIPGVSKPLVEWAGELCYDDWMGMLIGLTPDPYEVSNPSYMSDPVSSNWVLSSMAFGGFGFDDNTLASASGPAYLLFGGLDPLNPLPLRTAYLADLDQKGVLKYTTDIDEHADHDTVLSKTADKAMKWFKKQFAAAR